MMQRPIGILTFHRARNDGSILQTICLSNLLKQAFGTDSVSVVDYFPRATDSLITVNFLRSMRSHFRQMSDAREKYLRQNANMTLTAPLMTANILRLLLSYVGVRHLVMGSDTIWDPANHETKKSHFNPYFFDMSSLEPGLSHSYFAASSDPDFGASLTSIQSESLSQGLRSARFIGCRDEDTRRLVTGLVPEVRVNYLPDPTLLFWPEDLVPSAMNNRTSASVMRIGIQIGASKIAEQVIQDLSNSGYTCVNLYRGEFLEAPSSDGYSTFSRSIMARQQLDGLVTDRFHGAIIFFQTNRHRNCPVVMLRHANKWTHGMSKIEDLFIRLDAAENVISVGQFLSSDDLERIKGGLNCARLKRSSQLFEAACALRETSMGALSAFFTAIEASLK